MSNIDDRIKQFPFGHGIFLIAGGKNVKSTDSESVPYNAIGSLSSDCPIWMPPPDLKLGSLRTYLVSLNSIQYIFHSAIPGQSASLSITDNLYFDYFNYFGLMPVNAIGEDVWCLDYVMLRTSFTSNNIKLFQLEDIGKPYMDDKQMRFEKSEKNGFLSFTLNEYVQSGNPFQPWVAEVSMGGDNPSSSLSLYKHIVNSHIERFNLPVWDITPQP